MVKRTKAGKLAYTRQERNAQIIEMLFKFHLTSWRPSSHQIAIGLGLRPSHHVRSMLNSLHECGLVKRTEQKLPNSRIVHRWYLSIEDIAKDHPEWKKYLMEKYGVWPMALF